MTEKTAAVLTINKPGLMTTQGHKEIAEWLRKQATWLEEEGENYSNTQFRARYLYSEKEKLDVSSS